MTCLRVEIVAFVDESFPGFVRCAFADANGDRHTFIEKIPVVTTQDLWSDSIYPQLGTVPCEKVESVEGSTDRGLSLVSISVGDSMGSPRYSKQFIKIPDDACFAAIILPVNCDSRTSVKAILRQQSF